MRAAAQDGLVQTTHEALARSHGVHERTVRAALHDLEARGIAKRTTTRGEAGAFSGVLIRLIDSPPGAHDATQKPAGRPMNARPLEVRTDLKVPSVTTALLPSEVTTEKRQASGFCGCSIEGTKGIESTKGARRPLDARWTPAGETNLLLAEIRDALREQTKALKCVLEAISTGDLGRKPSEATTTPRQGAATPSVPLAEVPLHPANSRAPIENLPSPDTDEGQTHAVAKQMAIKSGRSEQEAEAFALRMLSFSDIVARRALQATEEEIRKGTARDPVRLAIYLAKNKKGVEGGNWESFEQERRKQAAPKLQERKSSEPISISEIVRKVVPSAPPRPVMTPEQREEKAKSQERLRIRLGGTTLGLT